MAASEHYRRQVGLLIRVLPLVAQEQVFALKGGTAINLFIRDLPRLSVDIDLTYLPVAGRPESLADIGAAMKRIAVTPVTRGCVYGPERKAVSPRVEAEFGFAETQLVSFADLYAGKLVAALDRQHPRDLFDVRDLLATEGIDGTLRTAFVIYMLSHNRPMAEVLAPTRKEISQEFQRGFSGMTEVPVTVDDLVVAREQLIAEIVGNMPRPHRDLLVSFEAGEPDWSLIDVPQAAELPAVRWRQENLNKLDRNRRKALVDDLTKGCVAVTCQVCYAFSPPRLAARGGTPCYTESGEALA